MVDLFNCCFVVIADGGRQTKASSGAMESGGSGFDNPCFDSGKFIFRKKKTFFFRLGKKKKMKIVDRPCVKRTINILTGLTDFGVNGLVSL